MQIWDVISRMENIIAIISGIAGVILFIWALRERKASPPSKTPRPKSPPEQLARARSGSAASDTYQAPRQPAIGIITVLAEEYDAVKAAIKSTGYTPPRQKDGKQYYVGEMRAAQKGKHCVVLSRVDITGTNAVRTWATNLRRDYPSVRTIIVVGVADGVPHPDRPDEDVRLGDVVLPNEQGITQYDLDDQEHGKFIAKSVLIPLNARLLEAARQLAKDERPGESEWTKLIDMQLPVRKEPGRRGPRVFVGPIAAVNAFPRNRIIELRNQHGIKAVEKPDTGIADTSRVQKADYFVVRGIGGYFAQNTYNQWRGYAAAAAAACTQALLERIPSSERGRWGWIHKRGLWLAVAGVLCLILGASLWSRAFYLMLPPTTPTLTITPTVPTMVTSPAPSTPMPVSPIFAATPSNTPMPTVTPTATRTHTPTPSPTRTPIPTPRATATPTLLPAPKLTEPGNDSHGSGYVQFKWTWDGNLSEDRWYAVRIWPDGEQGPGHSKTWEKGTTWQAVDLPGGWYRSHVVVIGTRPGTNLESCKPYGYGYEQGKNICYREISLRSEERRFFFEFPQPPVRP